MVRSTGTFGRKEIASSPAPPEKPDQRQSPNKTPNASRKLFDRLFFWVPNEEHPGPAALCFAALRIAVLASVLILAPIISFALVLAVLSVRNFDPWSHGGATPELQQALIGAYILGCVVIAQELGRYGFVRRAQKPLRAVSLFAGTATLGTLTIAHQYPYFCLCAIACQILASAAVICGLRQRLYLPALIILSIIGQTAAQVASLYLPNQPQAQTNLPAQLVTPQVKTNAATPSPDGMPTWAKLYPGAVVTSSQTISVMGTTTWQVIYRVEASPEEIGDFYQALSNTEGFNDTNTLLGNHYFTQDSTQSRYSYSVTTDGSISEVLFKARASAN